jgi:hypothetical protein
MLIGQSAAGAASAEAFARARACELFVEARGDRCLALLTDARCDETDWTFTPIVPLFAGGRHGPDAGEWLFCVGLWVPAGERREFLAWYQHEHLPILLECPTWDGCRFVEAGASHGCQFYALHQLSDRAALESPERARSRGGPAFERLKRFPWFDEPFTRTLYRRFEGDRR